MDWLTRYRRTVRDLRDTAAMARRAKTESAFFTLELCALKMEQAANELEGIITALVRMGDDGK